MTDDIHIDEHNEEAEFEREDLGAKPVILFLVGLTVGCLLVALLLKGMYSYLDARENRHQPALNPLVQQTTADTRLGYARATSRNFPSRAWKPTNRERSEPFECRKNRRYTVMVGSISPLAWCGFRLTAPWNCWRSAGCPPGRRPARLRHRK